MKNIHNPHYGIILKLISDLIYKRKESGRHLWILTPWALGDLNENLDK